MRWGHSGRDRKQRDPLAAQFWDNSPKTETFKRWKCLNNVWRRISQFCAYIFHYNINRVAVSERCSACVRARVFLLRMVYGQTVFQSLVTARICSPTLNFYMIFQYVDVCTSHRSFIHPQSMSSLTWGYVLPEVLRIFHSGVPCVLMKRHSMCTMVPGLTRSFPSFVCAFTPFSCLSEVDSSTLNTFRIQHRVFVWTRSKTAFASFVGQNISPARKVPRCAHPWPEL